MPINLAGAGLAMKGANEAESDINVLRGQKLGLDERERDAATEADLRNVAKVGGSHEDMATAAEKRGDYKRAEEHRRHAKNLEDEAITNVVKKALTDPTPGDRPDLVAEANRYGRGGMKSMTLDERGNLTFAGSKSGTMNVGVAAERMGLVKPFDKVVPAGSTYIRGNPATGQTTSFTAPDKGPNKGFEMGTIARNGVEYKVSFNKDTGEATLLDEGGNPTRGEAKVHTDPSGKTFVTVGKDVFEVTPGTPGKPGETHWFRPDEPAQAPTPGRLTPVTAGDQPPLPNARKAPDGNWYVPDPNNQGKFLQVVVGGQPAAAPRPAARPASAAAPAAAPAGGQAAPSSPPAPADEDKLPEVAQAPGLESPAARHKSRIAAATAEQEKSRAMAPKQRAVDTFRSIASSPRMTADDAPLIQEAIDTGLLTPAEKSKAERMLSKLKPQTAGYKKGGKVQRYADGGLVEKDEAADARQGAMEKHRSKHFQETVVGGDGDETVTSAVVERKKLMPDRKGHHIEYENDSRGVSTPVYVRNHNKKYGLGD